MKKQNCFIVFCLFFLFFVLFFHSQKGKTVLANEETNVDVLDNEYGKVSIRKIDHQLRILYRLNKQTQETRFLFQLHPKGEPETNLLSSYASQKYQEYTDGQQRKWLTEDFLKVIEEKEWIIELPSKSTSKEFQFNIQIEEKNGELLLSEPVSFSFSIDNKNLETAQTSETPTSHVPALLLLK